MTCPTPLEISIELDQLSGLTDDQVNYILYLVKGYREKNQKEDIYDV